ncbi:MAG: aspartate/glutamate racemase family protein [Betaproteobacteria bacterium]
MGKTLAVIHTGPVSVEPLARLIAEALPSVRLVNIVDDSLLKDVIAAGGVTSRVARRLCQYMMISEDMGADVILNACSSVGEVVEVARNLVSIPIVRVDEPMAERAAEFGETIGVVATVKTTLDPTARLIGDKAAAKGKKVSIKRALCSGAFEALSAGNPEEHDRLLTVCVEDLAKDVDVIVLAQVSMARLAPKLAGRVRVPVMTSPKLAVEAVKRVIDALP